MVNTIQEPESAAARPSTQVWYYCDPPALEGGHALEFRLVYKGSLPAETNKPRTEFKQRIRSQLHPQIQQLTESHPGLNRVGTAFTGMYPMPKKDKYGPEQYGSYWEYLSRRNKVVTLSNHIHRFVPLVTEDNYNGCAVDVLFLRRDMPGGIVKHGGDIDNRIKVLLDGLRMPREPQDIVDAPQPPTEDPCFCLLADDKYIDQLTVTTDRLLSPMEDAAERIHDVMLVIHVRVSLFDPNWDKAPV